MAYRQAVRSLFSGPIADDVREHCLIDPVPGEVFRSHGRGDGLIAVGGIDQADGGSGPAEIAYGNGSAVRQARVQLQREKCCRGIG